MGRIPAPVLILKASANADFPRVTWDLENVEQMAQRSLYLCFPIENMKNRIKLNCIAQFWCSFKSVQFRELRKQ
jgi:hypothetical protein